MSKPNYEKTPNFSQEKAYLVPNAELRGIGIPYATASDYFDASRLMDPTVVAGDSLSILSIPSPIVGKYIHLPDGNVSGPGLAWQGEVTTGLYRIGTANVGQSVLGALKWDWNATRMKFASGFSLGINTEPSAPLHVLKTTEQMRLSYDSTHSTTFTVVSNGTLEVTPQTGQMNLIAAGAITDYATFSVTGGPLYITSTDRLFRFTDRGENDGVAVYLQVYNTDSGDPNAHALIEMQVDPAVSGDPFLRFRVDNASSFWSCGLDNSDSDSFKVSRASTLGTNDFLVITTGGLHSATISNALTSPHLELLQASTGDSALRFTESGSHSYIIGIDNSDSDKWKLCYGATGNAVLGTNDYITVSTAGVTTLSSLALSGFTQGSVLFAGASSAISQNNAAFFWDNTNAYLGIGTATPSRKLHIKSIVTDAPDMGFTNAVPVTWHMGLYLSQDSFAIAKTGVGIYQQFSGARGDVVFPGNSGSSTDARWRFQIGGSAVDNTGSIPVLLSLNPSSVTSGDTFLHFTMPTSAGTYTGFNFVGFCTGEMLFALENKGVNAAAHTHLQFTNIGATGGDLKVSMTLAGVLSWAFGVDNSDSDTFKLSLSQNLGTSDVLFVTTSSYVGIGVAPISQFANTATNMTDALGVGGHGADEISWSGNGQGYIAAFENRDSAASFRNAMLVRTAASDTSSYILNVESNGVNRVSFRADGAVIHDGGAVFTINESQADCDFRIEGDSISHLFFTDATATTENIALLAAAAPNWQSMDRGLFVGDASAAPSGNPSAGHFYYSNSGVPTWRLSGGPVVLLSQATGGENVTNNVTDTASTNGTIPDFTNGTIYATDYTNIRNAIFQIARMLKQDHDQLRAMGILT